MRRLAATAMPDLRQSAIGRRLDEMTRACRRETGRAGQRMDVIPGQEHDLAGPHLDGGFAVEAEQEFSRDHEVVGDQERRLDQEGTAVLGEDLRVHAPRRREVRVEENASRQANRPKHFRERVDHRGHLDLDGQSGDPAGRSFTPAQLALWSARLAGPSSRGGGTDSQPADAADAFKKMISRRQAS